ncbi:CoxG family protein [Polynucleobacter rarus]|uniref:CoxG family protein n=1 Tax=Polynucleobacter rarus TaxID=556055 RepID=UPI000D3E0FEE|nr:carbon monoxide dehydrogenase subunit G [Polynucleobacter rarus]
MEILGSQVIPADKQTVWNALNNPEVLKNCLPGCESVELTAPDQFKVAITTAIGPLKAKFKGTLQVTEANPPESCILVFEGQGGAVGFGKGSSKVTLTTVENGTELSYNAQAHVGGKLAQIGSRLIDSVAKKMSDDFFKAFNRELSPVTPEVADEVISSNTQNQELNSTSSNSASNSGITRISPAKQTLNNEGKVPAWWLIVAALTGALITGLAMKLS